MQGERGQNSLEPRENQSEQDKGGKRDGGEGSKGKVVEARSQAAASKAMRKGSIEEEAKSRDEFDELCLMIDVLQNQVLRATKKDGVDEESSGL